MLNWLKIELIWLIQFGIYLKFNGYLIVLNKR